MHTVELDLNTYSGSRQWGAWEFLKWTAMQLLHFRKERNEVLIVQGYTIHILIYCLDTVL